MAKSKQDDQTAASELAQLNKLNAIKEIIFGEEKQDLDKKLEELRTEVVTENQEVYKKIDDLQSSLSKQLAEVQASLSKQLEEQEQVIQKEIGRIDLEKINRADLGDLLIELGKKLKA